MRVTMPLSRAVLHTKIIVACALIPVIIRARTGIRPVAVYGG